MELGYAGMIGYMPDWVTRKFAVNVVGCVMLTSRVVLCESG